MTITLRPATPDDLDRLDALHTRCMREHVERIHPWSETFFRETFDHRAIEVVVVDGEECGMLKTTIVEDALHLNQISVAPEMQGRGVGSALLEIVIARAERRGLPVRLHVLFENPARRLYESYGFVAVEERAMHHVMLLPLTNPPRQ